MQHLHMAIAWAFAVSHDDPEYSNNCGTLIHVRHPVAWLEGSKVLSNYTDQQILLRI